MTATSFSGNGASLTNLNGSNIASGTVPTARLGSGTANNTTFLRGDSTFAVVDTALVADTSPQLGGDLDCNDKLVTLNDSTGAGNNRLKIGNAGDLQLFHTSNANYVSGEVDGKDLYVRSRRDLHLVCGNNASAYRNVIYADNNGSTRIYHPASNAVRIQTSSSAVTFTGNVMPASDNTYDLGSLTARWANVFVGDMNLSNKGKANDVDGTWGNYTLQEGESDLFLINNRTGKRYKFNLTEIPLGDD